MSITKTAFGTTISGEEVSLFTVKNATTSVDITDFGCALVSMKVLDKNGKIVDVVLGYDDFSSYESKINFFGAVVGRYANRIADGKFSLNDTVYTLAKNDNGKNHLHGGNCGFDKRIWKCGFNGESTVDSLVFTLTSKDGDEGYPGELLATVTYTLDGGTLSVKYDAVADADTIVNFTNHSYFNLDGGADILNHELVVNADRVVETDADAIPTGKTLQVFGTAFDFTTPHLVGERIRNPLLETARGYDHSFFLNGNNACTLKSNVSGIVLDVVTTKPSMQVYTANFVDNVAGKGDKIYGKHSAICLETQFAPDSINQRGFDNCILRKGEHYSHSTEFRFSVTK